MFDADSAWIYLTFTSSQHIVYDSGNELIVLSCGEGKRDALDMNSQLGDHVQPESGQITIAKVPKASAGKGLAVFTSPSKRVCIAYVIVVSVDGTDMSK